MKENEYLLNQLKKWFAYDAFRPGQMESIQSILNGQHTLSVLPTGTGKSLIYQYCGYSIEGLVIIVSPLLSLMDNQVMQLNQAGEKRAAALNSMLSQTERRLVESRIDTYKFLFVSPEMLQSKWLLQKFMNMKIALFVVDEAHCISQWGLDFRPDYLFLGEVRNKLGNPLTLALTATAPEMVRNEILKALHLESENTDIHLSSPNRDNIYYQILEVNRQEKDDKLLEMMSEYVPPGVIYFSSKPRAEEVCQLLKQRTHLRIDTYHADRTTEDRQIVQRQFLNGELDVICATSAFGMGINKENIRFVIHYHMPNSVEEYLQEIGRAGRDGKQSIATLLYSKSDAIFKYKIIRETKLTEQFLKAKSNNEEILKMGLSDSDLAMVKIIAFHKLRSNEAMQLVENRIQDRVAKFTAMGHLITTPECKRDTISNYFKQTENEKPEWCCSVCQKDAAVLLNEMEASKVIQGPERENMNNWKEIIKGLFLF
ncbi:RecQ family ATP-dependent DNA helicase [Jeotgalibaca sp. A122]|uniref:RecQ family ATP-dependent DNA helicase n=1 Tax=Jeotgalibaca sp. A122 TaxID=3457322 RepID=UPI003FD4A10A